MPIAITDEQLALQASIRDWAKRAGTIEVVRGLEPGVLPQDRIAAACVDGGASSGGHGPAAQGWASLAELGVFGIGLQTAAGLPEGSAADLAAALAQLTESLAPGPVAPTMLAGLALASCPDRPAVRQHLAAMAAGEISVAVALDTGTVTGVAHADGSLLLTGKTGYVAGGGSTTHLLVAAEIAAAVSGGEVGRPDGTIWCLLPMNQPGVVVAERAPADFSRTLADISLTSATARSDQRLPGLCTERVRDLAAVIAAVEAAAVASWCSRTSAKYAAIRHQFGRPIGSFQAVKHLCAGQLCRAETAAVLAWDAARAVDDTPGELSLIAAAAAAFNLDAAVSNAKDCIQVLGGIGFTWEHDAHLYLRRALALRQLLGGTAVWRDRTAGLALAGATRRLMLEDATEVSDELAAIRQEAKRVAADLTRMPPAEQRRALADSGYAAPAWPTPYGLAASPAAQLIIDEELATAGLARPDIVIGGWAIPAIFGHGSAAQAERFAGPTLRGEITWCQLFSEPEAGSDLASLRTRAERTDGGWRLTGQKVWTSLARQADWAICLARTDATVPEHKGLTYFLVAMNSPGIDIRPLREITGREMFNQVFLDKVFVPDECVVGAAGDGWRVARTTLASERVAMGAGSSVGDAAERLLELARRAGVADDPVVRQRLGFRVAEGLGVSLLDLQAVIFTRRGVDLSPVAAIRKLAGVGHRQAVAEAALELADSAGPLADADLAEILAEFLLTRCLSIAGGTTQILLNVVGERLLGLPREKAR